MRVWAVANQKGGVGKTTTTLALGSLLAGDGRSVLMLDLDPHASMTRSLGVPADPVPRGVVELFDDPPASIGSLCRPVRDGLDFIAAQPALATLEKRSATRPGMGLSLMRALDGVRHDLDYVLLDCPPTLGLLMVNALAAADRVIVPTQTEPLALHGLDGMRRTVAMIERSRRRPLPLSIIPTLHDRRTRVAVDSLEKLRTENPGAVFDGVVPVDTRLRDPEHLKQASAQAGRGLGAYAQALDWLLGVDRAMELAA